MQVYVRDATATGRSQVSLSGVQERDKRDRRHGSLPKLGVDPGASTARAAECGKGESGMTNLVNKEALRELRIMKHKIRHIIDTPSVGMEVTGELFGIEASLVYAAKLLKKQIQQEPPADD